MNRIAMQLFIKRINSRYLNSTSVKNDRFTPRSNPGVHRRLRIISEDEPEVVEKAEIDYDSMEELEQNFLQAEDMHNEAIDEMTRISKANKFKITERRHFKPPKEPSMLTWSEKEQIKHLHLSDPLKWTPELLAESFPASPTIIKKILKWKWKPVTAERLQTHDRRVSDNWKAFHKGQLDVYDLKLKDHLAKFTDRKDGVKMLSDEEAVKFTEQIRPKPEHTEFISLITSFKQEPYANNNQQGDIKEISLNVKQEPYTNKNQLGDIKEISLNEKQTKTLSNHRIFNNPTVNYTLDQYCRRVEEEYNQMADCPQDLSAVITKTKEEVKKYTSSAEIYVAPSERFKSNAVVFQVSKKSPLTLKDPDNLPYKIQIPKEVWQQGKLYRVNDSFYNDRGHFLYKVPGLKY